MISPDSLRHLYRASTVGSTPDAVEPAAAPVAVVTCMDHRLRLERSLGPAPEARASSGTPADG
jgi:hypothetical protein